MYDFHQLVQRAKVEHRYQPGLIDIEVEGTPGCGLRYRFEHEPAAEKFITLVALLRNKDPGTVRLWIEGCDVVEVWE
jgi:hypothetical protein